MSTNDRILRKIEKCLALSRSSNEHEAAAALRQAKALMEKHQLTMADVEMNKIDVVTSGSVRTKIPPKWKVDLYLVAALAFGCSLFSRGGQMTLVGPAPGPEVAKYALEVLLRQLELNKKVFLNKVIADNPHLSRSQKIRLGKGYSEGWACGCRGVVETFAAALSPDARQQHEDRLRQHFNLNKVHRASKQKSALASDVGLFAGKVGYSAGKDAKIHAGMGMDGGPALLEAAGAA